MGKIQDMVEIRIEVTTDEDYGTVYVATNDELGLVTDGETFEELLENLHEALNVCLKDAAELNIAAKPRIILTMEMPSDAQTA